jgi:hypothetical protein
MFDNLNYIYFTQVYNIIVQTDRSYYCDHFWYIICIFLI